MSETELLKIRIELEALITEREGMIAENAYQSSCVTNYVPYGYAQFYSLQQKITALLERMK